MPETYTTRQRFPESALWAHVQTARMPALATFEVTARCGLDCRHCYLNRPAGDQAVQAQELSLDELLDLAEQAVALGALWCTLTGGDPLLREDFIDLYLGMKRLGLLVSVFTNATRITAEHARLWRAYPPRDVEVTVYGATAASYEHVTRRPGSYAAFQRGLEHLRAAGVPVRLKALALRGNQQEWPALMAQCQAQSGAGTRFSAEVHLRTDGDPRRNAEIAAERLSPEAVAACHCGEGDPCLPPETAMVRPEARRFRCRAGWGDFTVGADGRYRLCTTLTAPGTTYDLRTGTLREAWEVFTPAVLAAQASPEAQAACGRCTARGYCRRCPAVAYVETGDLDGQPEYFCAIAKARQARNK